LNIKCTSYILSVYILSIILVSLFFIFPNICAQESDDNEEDSIIFGDRDLYAKLVVSGLDFPTTMAFISGNDFLVLEKNTGFVKRVTDGIVQTKPLLELDVDSKDERGLLGIDIDKKYLMMIIILKFICLM